MLSIYSIHPFEFISMAYHIISNSTFEKSLEIFRKIKTNVLFPLMIPKKEIPKYSIFHLMLIKKV